MEKKQDHTSKSDGASPNASFAVSPPGITLPKGGGAIRGIGEKFAANPVTGTASLAVPIATSPGRAGFGPQLALSYDSGSGNGPFGYGWSLGLPSITRKTDKGLPRYLDEDDSDVFILSGAEDLVPALVEQNGAWVREPAPDRTLDGEMYRIDRFRPRIEGPFSRIERWTSVDTQVAMWRSISRDNVTTWYGKSEASRIFDPANPRRVFTWLISESYDDKGNAIVYEHVPDDSVGVDLSQACEQHRSGDTRSSNRYLKRIKYGNLVSRRVEPDLSVASWMFEAVFDYGEGHYQSLPPDAEGRERAHASCPSNGSWPVRADPFSSYRAGFEIRTYRLCRRVLMFHHFVPELGTPDCLVASTEFRYDETTAGSFMTAVSRSGYLRDAGEIYLRQSLPPLEFEYSKAEIQSAVRDVDAASVENLPTGLADAGYQWIDLDGEGLSGILIEHAGSWFYKRNVSAMPVAQASGGTAMVARFASVETVTPLPSARGIAAGGRLLDLAGDGRLDVVGFERPSPGFFERGPEGSWKSFVAFTSVPNVAWDDPNLKFVDLTGDGRADILIADDSVFTWYPSQAEAGFGPAERVRQALEEDRGPRVVFADGTQSIHLADLSGDGLTDIVRIRNGEVCYWPNLGYGRFGARVTMDDPPWFDAADQLDQKRILLADVDGSGFTDILYVGAHGVRLWRNQSGNRWAAAEELPAVPGSSIATSMTVADLFGNGTACLVWSSPLPVDAHRPMRYVDLMGGRKPHLMIASRNNLGAETRVEYASSTRFYLADKLAGKPWITRLPFPVHCVETVTVTDKWRKSRFSTRYSYHHGYFDGTEREFRGFGRVEQVDVESFGEFAAGTIDSPYITDDKTLYQPPVKTVTWFHTGAFLDRAHVLSQFQHEYFPASLEASIPGHDVLGGFVEHALPEPNLQAEDLDPDEWREALRACKGTTLRQEIYELDVDALEHGAHVPVRIFSAASHNCGIQVVQRRGANRHAVFFVTQCEAIAYHYELDLRPAALVPDPRVAHTLNLTTDEFGNVLQSMAVAYPRLGQHEDSSLPPGAEDLIAQVQGGLHLAYTENRYTNNVDEPDNYRLCVPCEVLTYELTGIGPESGGYFASDELRQFRLSEEHQTSGEPVAEIAYHELADHVTRQKRLVAHTRTLFFGDDLMEPLAFRNINALGLPFEIYKLALTDDLLNAVLGAGKRNDVQSDLSDASKSGYLSGADLAVRFSGVDTSGQYWIRSGIAGFAAGAQNHFYLPDRYGDPFGQITTLQYDARDLFLQSSADPAGNEATVTQFDYRVLAPRELKTANENLSEARFDLLGLCTATALTGKGNEGDSFTGFGDDLVALPLETRITYFTHDFDEALARQLLGNATGRHIYYFGEVRAVDGTIVYGAHPPCAGAIVRERHVAQLGPGELSPIQAAFEYSDGNGEVLTNKIQAEPEHDGGPLRWIASGKTIVNNKGNPVKRYEPYFTAQHVFEEPVEIGVTPVMYYDAEGRLTRSEAPDGSFSRVEFSPWHKAVYDANDTVLDSRWYGDRNPPDPAQPLPPATPTEQRAAWLAALHHGTPALTMFDSLGRDVIAVAHNRVESGAGIFLHGGKTYAEEKYLLFTKLDAEGKPLWVRDARGNLVAQYIMPIKPTQIADEPDPANPETMPEGSAPCYDVTGRLLRLHSMDAGDRWSIDDALGEPFYRWDVNERITAAGTEVLEHRVSRTVYDALRRPLEQQLRINDGEWQVVERFTYGEGQPNDKARNLRGKVARHHDQGGRQTNEQFDFKGNPVEITRQVAAAYDAAAIHWPANVPPAALEPEVFTRRAEFDAFNRMTRLYNWHTTPDRVAVYEPRYNERGPLDSEELVVGADSTQADPVSGNPYMALERVQAIARIAYDAKGQRTRIEYGNGAITTYAYDPETFRLTRVATTRPAAPGQVQDLNYTYDAVGNVTDVQDAAQQTVYFMNASVEPHCAYAYDALYRLVQARGRESASDTDAPSHTPRIPDVGTFPLTDATLRNYTQRYQYDSVGNLLQMQHQAGAAGSWTRDYEYAADSNRLLRSWTGGDPTTAVEYDYDIHGSVMNLAREPDAFRLRWDYRDMIHHANLGGGGQAWYTTDVGKQRVRKRIERLGGVVEERFYLGGMERYRRSNAGGVLEEIETFHLLIDDQRALIVEDVLTTDRPELGATTLYRYQLGNHLRSACLDLDEQAQIVCYEEFHPYGSTSYHAGRSVTEASLRRYRYTGMERDEETGLGCHGLRHYASWLGRWASADPGGLVDGPNVYAYARNNPVVLHDPTGTQADKPNVIDHVIMQMTDPELHKYLSTMSPELQRAFASGATGKFAERAAKMISKYNLQGVQITSKTRTIGTVAPYSKQGKANYLNMFGCKRRADEAEHADATAAAKYLLQETTDKWKRESPTIVLAEAHSRLKTPTDNQLTRDLKAGKITAEEWFSHSRTNAYRSWFEARAQGMAHPTAEEMANAIIQQETELKIRYYAKLEERMKQIQRDAVYGPANNVTRFQGMVQTRLDQTAEAQAHGQVRTQITIGVGMVAVQMIASLGIITGGILATAPAVVPSVPAATATTEGTTMLRIAAQTAPKLRIAVQTAPEAAAAGEAAAVQEALAVEEALAQQVAAEAAKLLRFAPLAPP